MNNKRNYIIQCTEVRPSGITIVTTIVEYSLLDSFNSYPELTPTQLGGLSDSEYSTRLSDFIDFIGTIDFDTKTQLILDSTYYDPLCVKPLEIINVVAECDAPPTTTTTTTTTTTAAPTTTTTTTAAPTTTTTTTAAPVFSDEFGEGGTPSSTCGSLLFFPNTYYYTGTFGVGTTIYVDSLLTIPLTGWKYVAWSLNTTIYELNITTGTVISKTAFSC